MKLTQSEKLMYSLVRLECELKSGGISTGTGFIFSFHSDNTLFPFVITNKHVVRASKKCSFVMTCSNGNGVPVTGKVKRITITDPGNNWIFHPDDSIDLAAMPLAPILFHAKTQGSEIFFQTLPETGIPDQQQLSQLSVFEPITMIGYPNGLWDEVNNMPIVRRGFTATHPKLKYNGRSIFLIDCACFPGSSGSPVCIFEHGAYESEGNVALGARFYLLGVLFAGPQHTAQGEIKTIDLPLVHRQISLSSIPNNLGFVIQAEKLVDFKGIISNPEAAKHLIFDFQ